MADTNFDHDVFISYARFDNEPLGKDQDGWISTLHRALEKRLSQLLGERPKIWRDDANLQGNADLDPAIVDQLIRTAVLISVLSPRYLKSEWCMREIETFIKTAEQSGSLRINNKFRIFKVVKTFIPLEEQPAEFQRMLGYEFFKFDEEKGYRREFNRAFGKDLELEFWKKLEDLAQEIQQLLKILKSHHLEAPPTTPSSGVTVYLAETTSDLNAERDQIRRELQARGHTVLPDRPLPLVGADLEEMIKENLARCTLSIHLIGGYYGIVPEAAHHSVGELQHTLAAEHSQQTSGFSRLIWLPPGLEAKDERQQTFVNALQDEPALQRGDDLLQTTLEDLKTAIQDTLNAPAQEEETSTEQGPTRIYLICDTRDLEAIEPLEEYLYDQGFEPVVPLFDGDEATISHDHRANLGLCDAVLIYYGQADEAWLRGKLRDLQKAPGYTPYTPKRRKAIYVAGPENRAKTRYRTHEVDEVIKHFGDFAPDHLAPFLAKLTQRKGGSQ